MPALLIRMSKPPNLDSAVDSTRSQSLWDVTFATRVRSEPGTLLKALLKLFSFKSTAMTLAPSAAKILAVARPNPDAAPMEASGYLLRSSVWWYSAHEKSNTYL